MEKNEKIFEINTRVFLKRYSSEDRSATLKDVPLEYWDDLISLGMDFIWLMGIWKTNDSVVKEYCFEPFLVNEYNKALKDFKVEDVIGSPYSIDNYELDPAIGTIDDLLELKQYLNTNGVKLILDFVSNHFSAHSSLTKTNPELFLTADENFFKRDPHTYFRSIYNEDLYFAHGRDPFFPAWQDTVQLNYFNLETRAFMTNILADLTKICDGVRCDMAMLSLNNVFDNTWSGVLNFGKYEKPTKEFWKKCIFEIKAIREDFLFIGEAYWDLEWELQRLGFDYTYDKKLLDRLKVGHLSEIRGHLMADSDFQDKSVRFIENHDEERAVSLFGQDRSKAAAVIMSTIPGMKLYHDGQFLGKKTKLPIQLGREPEEGTNECLERLYKNLLNITKSEIFRNGSWELLKSLPAWEGSTTNKNFLVWLITFKERKRLVIINYSREVSQCRINLNLKHYPEKFKLKDILNSKTYFRKTGEVNSEGLFIELGPYKSHIFSY